jgi:hypothetical protein
VQYLVSYTIGLFDIFHPSPAPHFKNFPGISEPLSEVNEQEI